MKTSVSAAVLLAFAIAALAQSGVADRVKQRAIRVRNQAQATRAVPPAAPPVEQPPPPPPDPVLTATLQNISNLQRDLAGLKSEPAQKRELLNDLRAAAVNAKPSEATITKLADDLTTAAGGKGFTVQQTRLAQDLHAIFNSSHLSAAQQQAIFENVVKLLGSNGVSPDLAAQVRKDVERVAAETK